MRCFEDAFGKDNIYFIKILFKIKLQETKCIKQIDDLSNRIRQPYLTGSLSVNSALLLGWMVIPHAYEYQISSFHTLNNLQVSMSENLKESIIINILIKYTCNNHAPFTFFQDFQDLKHFMCIISMHNI